VDALRKAVPFYTERGLKLELVLTDSSLDYDGLWLFNRSSLSYLNRAGLSQQTMPTEDQASGFLEYFERAALDEYFWEALESYDTVEVLQRDFDSWLHYYNTERPHYGYPNMGKRPIEKIDEYLKNS
jgi:hypothetical protein